MIDHILTNTPDKIVCSGVSHVGISDHSLIYAFRKLSTGLHNKGHSTVNYRKFKNFNSESFRSDIFSQNWDVIRAYNNPSDMWRVWKTTFNNVVEMHAPSRVCDLINCSCKQITNLVMSSMDKTAFQA